MASPMSLHVDVRDVKGADLSVSKISSVACSTSSAARPRQMLQHELPGKDLGDGLALLRPCTSGPNRKSFEHRDPAFRSGLMLRRGESQPSTVAAARSERMSPNRFGPQ